MGRNRLVAVAITCVVVLSGCASTWDGDVNLKIDKITPAHEYLGKPTPAYVNVTIDQEHDPDMVEKFTITGAEVTLFPSDITVGDLVVCAITQRDDSGFDQEGPRTELSDCRHR